MDSNTSNSDSQVSEFAYKYKSKSKLLWKSDSFSKEPDISQKVIKTTHVVSKLSSSRDSVFLNVDMSHSSKESDEIDESYLKKKETHYKPCLSKNTFKQIENSKNSGRSKIADDCASTKLILYLNHIINEDTNSNEILLEILNKKSAILSVIKSRKIKNDLMPYLLIVVGKACSSNKQIEIKRMISSISQHMTEFSVNIQQYLVTFSKLKAIQRINLLSVHSLIIFLQKFQSVLPSSAADFISILVPLLSSTCEKYLKEDKELYSDTIKKLKEIEDENQYFIDHFSAFKLKKESAKEKLFFKEPPDNFRTLSVLPTTDDIKSPCLFLRPNKVKGKYENTDQYLDVQFRLLKEDYVKPLRDGIAEYLSQESRKSSHINCKDIKLYRNVKIIKEEFNNGELLHTLLFEENFSKINWDHNKRFLTGNLLCLSSNNFETMLFAAVNYRDTKNLRKGLLQIKFFEFTEKILNLCNIFINYTVIETSAYFEAYCHNLKALQQLHERNLPLKNYIIDVEKIVDKPEYLRESTAYDMRPLFIAFKDIPVRENIHYQKKHKRLYTFPKNIEAFKSVIVTNEQSWPTAENLNLDMSQYFALKTAVTKEFAVIQGPPGTGKTYIGLRTVQLLLHNINKWFLDERNSLPILIVCYTNHALDQFLEGLLLFTKNIARIGGKVSSDLISNYRLNSLKSNAIKNRTLPWEFGIKIGTIKNEIKNTKKKLEKIKSDIENHVYILFSKHLYNYIPESHYNSLLMHNNIKVSTKFIMHKWLSIPFISLSNTFHKNTKDLNLAKLYEKLDLTNNKLNDFESDNDPEIELIEHDRNLDIGDLSTDEKIASFPNLAENLQILNEDYKSDEEISEYDDEPNIIDLGDFENEDEWQVEMSEKKLMDYITKKLFNTKAMIENAALKIENVWHLNLDERWQLCKFWIEEFTTNLKLKSLKLQKDIKHLFEELKEAYADEDFWILKKCFVVGMTTTGAAKYRNLVQKLNPAILIVEEAAEILESHIVTSLGSNTQHVILIGDQQQLRPSITVHMLAVKYDLNISLFERMIENNIEYSKLTVQHRMRPEISSLIVPYIYPDLKNHKVTEEFENIKGTHKNVFFVSHTVCEQEQNGSKSKINHHEAKFLLLLCKYLLNQGYDSSQITILTTYSGQLSILKKFAAGDVRKVRMTVVDNFQGEENDIILISFVRSNNQGEIGFLKVSNRICVALSRAKKGLFCIGNFELLAQNSDLWQNIIKILSLNDSIGPSLKLMCQNHPETFSEVSTEKDFETVPDGGCTRSCEYRLECGHPCTLSCHPYNHDMVRCYKPCIKTCEEGHPCSKKCFQICAPCKTLVDKKLSCQHIIQAYCGTKEDEIKCTFPCERTCEEDHPCPKKCFETCDFCKVLVDKKLSCEHIVQAYCGLKKDEVKCTSPCEKILECKHRCVNLCSEICECEDKVKILSQVCKHTINIECKWANSIEHMLDLCSEPCNTILACNHKCLGTCSICYQGRLHVACLQKCERILICGHKCESTCSTNCPPCSKPCENKCNHNKCPRICGDPCKICKEPCDWSCPHKKCTLLCYQKCNREPCNEPCPKILPCSHPCLGFCGEICPTNCFTCDSAKSQSANDDQYSTISNRYVLLEDCCHIFEVNYLNDLLNKNSSVSEVEMKKCPTCFTVIRENTRFNTIIKNCLYRINGAKRINYGNIRTNSKTRNFLVKCLETFNLNDEYCSQILKYLHSQTNISNQKLTNIENVINIAIDFKENYDKLVYKRFFYTEQQFNCIKSIGILIRNLIQNFLHVTEQQLFQAALEICRLELIHHYWLYRQSTLKMLEEHLFTFTPFSIEKIRYISELKTSFIPNSIKKILEKPIVYKCLSMSVGHWYTCSNSHLYCVSVYNNKVQENICYICNNNSTIYLCKSRNLCLTRQRFNKKIFGINNINSKPSTSHISSR